MISNIVSYLEQINKYYSVWQEFNYVYEDWAKAHGVSVNSLLVLSAILEGMEDCTQKKISLRWRIPKQTVNAVLKDYGLSRFLTKWKVRMKKYPNRKWTEQNFLCS